MKSNYTRFGKNLITSGNVYDYVALDTVNDSVLRVAFRPSFTSRLPAEIAITCSENFTIHGEGTSHVVISEKEFWSNYDRAVSALSSVNQVELFEEENI